MILPRQSGILLHPTSLPGRSGIGSLGPAAYQFVDFLADTGQSLWQVLPLGPTAYGDSPYQSFSAFAGNPLLISLEVLAEEGLLEPGDLDQRPSFPASQVDYGAVIEFKNERLWKAFREFKRSSGEMQAEFEGFCEQAGHRLEDFVLFQSIKNAHGGAAWTKWESNLRHREPKALWFWGENHHEDVEAQKFFQYLFYRQWLRLAHYANDRDIRIIGDIPIFVAHDSADVWSRPELFWLDEEGEVKLAAGVPPDYFSKTGQLWGNPLYRWDLMAKDGYQWWIDRLRMTFQLVDIVRLDHFRGFEAYWAVPGGEETAVNGQWKEGPGAAFFEAIREQLGDVPIVVEDLGAITEAVEQLRDQFGFPGIRVLQFVFDPSPEAEALRPHSFVPNSVVYTGTHDNDTTVGWFENAEAEGREKEREFVLKYLGRDGREINWELIRVAMASVANTAIIPLQDVLGYGSEARMNVPARQKGNWAWRYAEEALSEEIRGRLREMTEVYGRREDSHKKHKKHKEEE